MSEFKNVSGDDRALHVDSHRYFAKAGETLTIPDEFDYQIEQQEHWKKVPARAPRAPRAPRKAPARKPAQKKPAAAAAPASTPEQGDL